MPGIALAAGIGAIGSLASGFLGGGGGDAANEAAAAQAAAKQQAIETLQRNLAPFRDAGTQALPGLQEASTLGGIDERLGGIFGGGTFQNLVGERTRAVQGQLAASGQSRSGQGLLEAARVPTDVGLQLEQLGQGRLSQLSNIGLNAAGNLGGGVAGLQAGIGRDIGSGIVTGQQADVANIQNAINTGVGIAGLFQPQQGAPLQGQPAGVPIQGQPGGQFVPQGIPGLGGPSGVAAGNPGQSTQVAINQLFGGL